MRTAVLDSCRGIFGFATITFQKFQLLARAMMSPLRGLSSRGHIAIDLVGLMSVLGIRY